MSQRDSSSQRGNASHPIFHLWGILEIAALVGIAPYYGLRMLFEKKYRAGLLRRLTLLPSAEREPFTQEPYLWVHAVSVGELQAARPLLRRIKSDYPEYKILVSTITETGQALARDLEEADAAIYFPLDLVPLCRRALRMVRPRCVIIFETEIWPGFIRAIAEREIPLFLVNARLSDRSYKKYRRARLLFAPVLSCFSGILAQSVADSERFLQIGARPETVHPVGNLKFEAAAPARNPLERDQWRRLLRIDEAELVLLGGSTFPGEEAILARVAASLRRAGHTVRLILAPRHIDRIPAVRKELEALQLTVGLRTQWEERSTEAVKPDVILLDTIGELRFVYSGADMVFIGKSLLEKGGQNPLEPAAWGKPILFGPFMDNFRDIASLLLNAGGAIRVADEADLSTVCADWCRNPERRNQIGRNALRVVEENQGALERIMEHLRPALSGTTETGRSA